MKHTRTYSLAALAVFSAFLTACNPPGPHTRMEREFATPEQKERAAKFITELCAASNPKSDEEPEDMIRQAEATALRLFGAEVEYRRSEKTDWQWRKVSAEK